MHANDRGFAIITTVLLLGISFAFSIVLIDVVLSGRQTGKNLSDTFSAQQIAEAGVHKAIGCLNATSGTNCGGAYGTSYVGQSGVSFGGGTFTTTVTGSGATKTITSTGWSATGRKSIILTDLTSIPPEDDPGFSYALQSGAGGAHMENNSSIQGTIYSNGDIDCQSTNAIITGDAYSSKDGGKIEKCRTNFHSRADRILDGKVDGNAYYENDPADIAGTTVTGTKYPGSVTPTVATMPSLNLDFWRDSAEAGGIIYGDYHPADLSSLGPKKIVGNLIMDNNVDLTITGPVWVVGNITTGNNSTFTLDSSFGSYSTTILADDQANLATKGFIDITNNTGIFGSGDAKSHILFATTNTSTSDTTPALSVANNATGAVFYAISGTLRLQNNGGAKSLAGYRLFIDQNAVITYVESDFTGSFSNSPGGIWRVKEGTWREAK
jgi:hypothetical protein